MAIRTRSALVVIAVLGSCLLSRWVVQAADFESASPPDGAHHVNAGNPIAARFSANMQAPGTGAFTVHGGYTGSASGTFSGAGSRELSFSTGTDFFAGERVEVTLTNALLDAGGASLSGKYVHRYRVATARGPMSFDTVTPLNAVGNTSARLADMNGDGWLDAVVATDTSIRIINNNAGSFATSWTELSAAQGSCNDFAVFDMDNDGDLDVMRSTIGSGNRSAYWRNNAGQYQGPNYFGAYSGGAAYGATNYVGWPQSVCVGDVNADGFIDIAVGTNGISMLYVNQAGAGFTSVNALLSGPGLCCTFADLDNDGDLDYVWGEMGGGYYTLNDGNANFLWGGGLGSSGVRHGCVETGDLNGDGWVDIVVGYESNVQPPKIHWNDGTGHFPTNTTLGARVETVCSIEVVDMNGDGHLDIWCADEAAVYTSSPSQLFVNDGAGGFAQVAQIGGTGTNPWILPIWGTIGDVDRDGDMDCVAFSFTGFKSYLWRNGGTGARLTGAGPAAGLAFAPRDANITASFSLAMANPAAGGFVARGAVSGPLAGSCSANAGTLTLDPASDLHANEEVEVSLTCALSATGAGFNGPHVYRFRAASAAGPIVFTDVTLDFGAAASTTCMAAGDLNRDGMPDMVEGVSGGSNRIHLRTGTGFNSMDAGGAAGATEAIALADFNVDGWLDLAIADNGGQSRVQLWNPATSDFTGGAINFGTGSDTSTCLAVGDMNGDGLPDIAVGNDAQQNAVYLNDGAGGFTQICSFGASAARCQAMAIADIDRDGALDVVVAGLNLGVEAWLNKGDGSLPLSRDIAAALADVRVIAVGDMNGDCYPDIALGVHGGHDQVLVNDGTGRFPNARNFGPAAGETEAIGLGDVDGDADLDLLCGLLSGGATLFVNDSAGGLTQQWNTGGAAPVSAACLVDMDADSDVELVVGRDGAANTVYFNEELPTISLAASGFYVPENAGSATVSVELDMPYANPVLVDYAATGGTAGAADFGQISGTLTFAPGQTSASFTVGINDDGIDENDETINLVLSNPVRGLLGTSAAALTILDDDGTPNVRFAAASQSAGEGAGTVTLTIELSNVSGLDVTVDYSATDVTASAGLDYTGTSGLAVIAAGSTSASVTLGVSQDNIDERDETFEVTLSNPQFAGLGALSSTTVTLIDDDAEPEVSLSITALSVNEADGTIQVMVRLSHPSAATVTVDFATGNGTATVGADYMAATGTLSFAPGTVSMSIGITLINDPTNEPSEWFELGLGNPVNGQFGANTMATFTIAQDQSDMFQVGPGSTGGGAGGNGRGCAANVGGSGAALLALMAVFACAGPRRRKA